MNLILYGPKHVSCGKISFDTFLIASISFDKSIDYYSPTINRICIRISCTGPVQVNKTDLAIKGFQKERGSEGARKIKLWGRRTLPSGS